MINTCRRYIDEFHMIKSKDLVIAGVSGGADSLCLFHVLNHLKGEMDSRPGKQKRRRFCEKLLRKI